MRILAVVLVAACGGGDAGLEVEEASCQAGQLHFVHDLSLDGGTASGEGSITTGGLIFGNAGFLDGQGNRLNGTLTLTSAGGSGSSMIVRVEFEDALLEGGTVGARGTVALADQGIEAGNCERADFDGRISDIGDGWKFTLVGLHAAPFCDGPAFSGSFAGCTRSSN